MATDKITADYLNKMLDEEPSIQNEREFVTTLRLLGYLQEDINLRKIYENLLTEQIGGFYDPAEGILYVAETFSSNDLMSQTVVAHEMCHALQDQHFDLQGLRITENK